MSHSHSQHFVFHTVTCSTEEMEILHPYYSKTNNRVLWSILHNWTHFHCIEEIPSFFIGLIKQFLRDVDWGDIDYLVVDTPPGTSDEHLSIVQYLSSTQVDGAVIITTPQEVSLMDVRKEINFCRKVNLPVIGVVENMSGFVCPKCKVCVYIIAIIILYIVFDIVCWVHVALSPGSSQIFSACNI